MFKKTCTKCAPWGLSLLRLALGAILIYHGWPKLFGDTTQLMAFFESTVLPAPGLMLILAGVIELVGGILLVLGLGTRYVTAIIALQFAVIILFVKLRLGWAAMEIDIIIFATALALMGSGAGAVSADQFICGSDLDQKGEKGGKAGEAITGVK